jgi:molybdenum cofactor synthesis domain-containing protein
MEQIESQSTMIEVSVYDAVGLRLAHDLTQILPGTFKGRLFKKGHIVTEEDIPKLLDIGKAHLYVLTIAESDLHEDDAALEMAKALCDDSMWMTEPHEGKVNLKAKIKGVVKIDEQLIYAINELGDIALATITSNRVVEVDQLIAATRIIPLIVNKAKIEKVKQLCEQYRAKYGHAPITVKALPHRQIGLITTGSEVYNGRIRDKFGPAVKNKLERLGSVVAEQRFALDDRDMIVNEILSLKQKGYDMILVTGGMSVDPDDRTPGAIKAAGTDIISYGTPMLPGSMLLIGYLEETPILGLPGCVMHDDYTSFDVLLPRILLGEKIKREDIVKLGYGGLLGR